MSERCPAWFARAVDRENARLFAMLDRDMRRVTKEFDQKKRPAVTLPGAEADHQGGRTGTLRLARRRCNRLGSAKK
jgi:hypothetical protein